jgi:hypothetical protein
VASVPAALDDGESAVATAVAALRHGLWLKQRGEALGERLQIAEGLGKDRLEVEAVITATERALAGTLRQRGGVAAATSELDEVTGLDALAQARADLRRNGAVQLVVERLLCGAAPSVLEQRR